MELKTLDDLNNIKNERIKEGEKWEFKLVWPNNERIERTICAFANTAGGIILIGVDYDNDRHEIKDFPGIDETGNLIEKAVDIGGNINPRVIPTSQTIPVASGKVVQMIQIFKSRMIPHMASNYIYYQRVNGESVPIPESILEKLYLARQVQRRDVEAFVRKNKYFEDFPGDPHWLSICFCPLYLEADLIRHARLNLNFLNSLIDIVKPSIVNIYFHTTPDGYKFELPHPKSTGKAIYNYLVKVLDTGIIISGMWIKDSEPSWEYILCWFNKMISFYDNLKMKFRYPGWTRIILVLTKMHNTKMVFPNSRMNALSQPMIENNLFIQLDLEDSEILKDHPEKVTERFYNKIKAYYGLDDYIT